MAEAIGIRCADDAVEIESPNAAGDCAVTVSLYSVSAIVAVSMLAGARSYCTVQVIAPLARAIAESTVCRVAFVRFNVTLRPVFSGAVPAPVPGRPNP